MLFIPDSLWAKLLDTFDESPRDVERVAYLDGLRLRDGEGVVTTVVVPDATLNAGWYQVSADAVMQAGSHMFTHGLVRLAQVHTHPTDWVDHSSTDDRIAYSQRPGAISIVLPDHARRRPRPADGGVHVRTSSGWRRLSASAAADTVGLVPSFLDFRPTATKRWWWQWLLRRR